MFRLELLNIVKITDSELKRDFLISKGFKLVVEDKVEEVEDKVDTAAANKKAAARSKK